jgi:hypothetical protein
MRLFGQNLTLAITSIGIGLSFGCAEEETGRSVEIPPEIRMSALSSLDATHLTPPRMLSGPHAPKDLTSCELVRNADRIVSGVVERSKLDLDITCEAGAMRGPKRVVELRLADGTEHTITLLAHQDSHRDVGVGKELVVGVRSFDKTDIGLGYFIVDRTRITKDARLTMESQGLRNALNSPRSQPCDYMDDAEFRAYLTHKPLSILRGA